MEKKTLLLYFLVADKSAGEEKRSLIRFLTLKLFADLTETGIRLAVFLMVRFCLGVILIRFRSFWSTMHPVPPFPISNDILGNIHVS